MKRRTYIDPTISSSDITPESVFLNRRDLIKASSSGAATPWVCRWSPPEVLQNRLTCRSQQIRMMRCAKS